MTGLLFEGRPIARPAKISGVPTERFAPDE